jgi:hypothetical protein
MYSQLKKLPLLLGLLTTLSASKCGTSARPKFDPDAYRANHTLEAIVNEDEVIVYADDEKFSEFACMHKSKWVELRKFVQLLRIDPEQKNLILQNISHAASETR